MVGWTLANGTLNFGDGNLAINTRVSYIAKFQTSDGTVRWKRAYDNPSSGQGLIFYGAAIDSNGDIYVVGNFKLSADLGNGTQTSPGFGLFIAKYSGNNSTGGNYLNSVIIPGQSVTAAVTGRGIVLDNANNVIISATIQRGYAFGNIVLNALSAQEGVLAKWNSGLSLCYWANIVNTPNIDSESVFGKPCASSDKSIVITGETSPGQSFAGKTPGNNGGFDAVLFRVNP